MASRETECSLLYHTGKRLHCQCQRDPGCPAQSHHHLSSEDPNRQKTNCSSVQSKDLLVEDVLPATHD